jgi:hypothetical protein
VVVDISNVPNSSGFIIAGLLRKCIAADLPACDALQTQESLVFAHNIMLASAVEN